MRNWNTSLFSHSLSISISFEPTYEELKQKRPRGFQKELASFEPTYEELKPSTFHPHFANQLCVLEPTYEELKLLFSIFKFCICKFVLSLPMRNWNMRCYKCSHWDKKGFEPTYEELKLTSPYFGFSNVWRFWAYLWGIETIKQVIHIVRLENCFEPTYEELKHFNFYFNIPKDLGFEPTYEELKPLPSVMFRAFISGFEPTYEELKHAS